MHELSLCEGIVSAVEDSRRREGFERVLRIDLEIGELACVDCNALRFGFDVVARDTAAEGARLAIQWVAGAGFCFECERNVPLHDRLGPCPECGGVHLRATAGDDLRVQAMEVM